MTKYIKDRLKDNISYQSTKYPTALCRFQCSKQTYFENIVVKHHIRDIILSWSMLTM